MLNTMDTESILYGSPNMEPMSIDDIERYRQILVWRYACDISMIDYSFRPTPDKPIIMLIYQLYDERHSDDNACNTDDNKHGRVIYSKRMCVTDELYDRLLSLYDDADDDGTDDDGINEEL